MESLRHGGLYCPSARSYSMSLATPAQLAAYASASSGFTSIYSGERNDLDELAVRVETFVFYPFSVPASVIPQEMAENGLFYPGDGDIVKCFSCKKQFGDFHEGDNPVEMHKRRSPFCPYLARLRRQQGGSQRRDSSDSELSDCIDGAAMSHQDTDSDLETDGPLSTNQTALTVTSAMQQKSAFEASRRTTLKSPEPTTVQKQLTSTAHKLTALKLGGPGDKKLDKEALRAENKRLKATITCRKCNKERVQTLFLPCRHLVSCENCAEKMDDCILCNAKILGTVRTFLI